MSTTYDVFARKEHPEPLTYIGSVKIENSDEVNQASLAAYGPESEWLEMVAIPQQEMIVVFPEKGADE